MKFELEKYHRNISEEAMIADLKRVTSQLKKTSITQAEYNKLGEYSSSTLIRRIGSWFTALEKAGLEKTRNLHLTEEDLIGDLIRVCRELSKNSVTRIEYEIHGKYSASPFVRRYGSWFKALQAAGLEKTRNLGVTDGEYFKNLEDVWIKLGRQPKYHEMQKPLSKYCAGAYEYRFGTWRKALEQFIKYINSEEIPKIDKNILNDKKEGTKSAIEFIAKHKTKRNISDRLRFIIMKRDNFKCKICGRSPATDPKIILHVDHIVAYTNGGETVPENLQTLCNKCNIGKSNLGM